MAREDGLILTNRHVIGRARTASIKDDEGQSYVGEVVLADRRRDLAAIRITKEPSHRKDLILKISDAQDFRVGDEILVICHPAESATFSLARGNISASSYLIREMPFLQANISVNWGNSGGPVLNTSGTVIGMVTRIPYTPLGLRVEGVCFAIPAEGLIRFVERIPSLEKWDSYYCNICGNFGTFGKYCTHCGVLSANSCPVCGLIYDTQVKYCEHCGKELGEAKTY